MIKAISRFFSNLFAQKPATLAELLRERDRCQEKLDALVGTDMPSGFDKTKSIYLKKDEARALH